MGFSKTQYRLNMFFGQVADSLYVADSGPCTFRSSARSFAKLTDFDENRFHSHGIKTLRMTSCIQISDLFTNEEHEHSLFLSFQNGHIFYPEQDDPALTHDKTKKIVKLGEDLPVELIERVLNLWEERADISNVLAQLLVLNPEADWKADAAQFTKENIEMTSDDANSHTLSGRDVGPK